MLSVLDKKLFPPTVQIIELPDSRVVYNIHKNGSSLLNFGKTRDLNESEIAKLDIVDVFVREPYQRFLTGVSTYAKMIDIDVGELAKVINDVYFINNHFCPQLFWIINLQRFTQAKIRINRISELLNLTKEIVNEGSAYQELDKYFKHNQQLKYYIELDCVLWENFIGQTVSYDDIIHTLKNNYNELYQDTFGYVKEICNVLD